jgi:hypothetical protein
MPLLAARSSAAAAMAADCTTSATLPRRAITGATLAFSPQDGTTRPPLPGPSTRTSRGRAASRMALRASATWASLSDSCSEGPTITARVPRSPSSATTPATSRNCAQMMARSGTVSSSETCMCAPSPNSDCFFARARRIGPLKPPPSRLRSTTSA